MKQWHFIFKRANLSPLTIVIIMMLGIIILQKLSICHFKCQESEEDGNISLNITFNSFDFLCETNKYLPLVSSLISDIPNSDSESFNPALWEEQRKHRAQVAFECDEDKDERETPPRVSGKLVLYLLQIVVVFYQQQLSVLVWIAIRVPFSQWSGRELATFL